jgi:hypothetical protein
LKDVMVSECLLILRRFLFIYSASFISIWGKKWKIVV